MEQARSKARLETLENAAQQPHSDTATPVLVLPCTAPLRIQPYTTTEAKAGTLFIDNAPETAIEADGQIVSIAALPELFKTIGHSYTPRRTIAVEYDHREQIAYKAGWGAVPVERPVYQWQHPPQGMFYLPSLLTI